MLRQLLGMLVFSGAVLLASGCGGGGVEGVKVTGSVTQGGKPQEAVTVSFIPADTKQGTSRGTRTNTEGKFELLVKPGQYTVVLTRLVDKKGKTPKDSEIPSEDYAQLEASGLLRHALPFKYASPTTSPLKLSIPPEGKDVGALEVK